LKETISDLKTSVFQMNKELQKVGKDLLETVFKTRFFSSLFVERIPISFFD
jgi:hypothetical protein